MVHPKRLKELNKEARAPGLYVLCWMQQSQRASWNHALEYSIERGNELGLPVLAYFGLTSRFPEANERHYAFMLEGLEETARALAQRGIRLVILKEKSPLRAVKAPARNRAAGGAPAEASSWGPEAGAVALAGRAALAVVDRGYLRIQRVWRERAAAAMGCPLVQVESDVVVPVETASPKEEYAASTLRPKIGRLLPEFLVPLDEMEPQKPSLGIDVAGILKGKEARVSLSKLARLVERSRPGRAGASRAVPGFELVDLGGRSIEELLTGLDVDRSVKRVGWIRGGASEAKKHLGEFINNRLDRFADLRNDPSLDCLSNMSPYLHFGQVSPLEAALAAREADSPGTDSFLEELVVRRELSMNFAFYNPRYDAFECLPAWALKTLKGHEDDRREHLYSRTELEHARTHDPYWNAAQREMVVRGKMHGYMRMYWGKKILEWSGTPEEAHASALALNNKYFIDGRDPNGFTGVAWCFGKHDRPWAERPVFGIVRYMNAKGLERKFDIAAYVEKIKRLGGTS